MQEGYHISIFVISTSPDVDIVAGKVEGKERASIGMSEKSKAHPRTLIEKFIG